jgi:hypothetical protein
MAATTRTRTDENWSLLATVKREMAEVDDSQRALNADIESTQRDIIVARAKISSATEAYIGALKSLAVIVVAAVARPTVPTTPRRARDQTAPPPAENTPAAASESAVVPLESIAPQTSGDPSQAAASNEQTQPQETQGFLPAEPNGTIQPNSSQTVLSAEQQPPQILESGEYCNSCLKNPRMQELGIEKINFQVYQSGEEKLFNMDFKVAADGGRLASLHFPNRIESATGNIEFFSEVEKAATDVGAVGLATLANQAGILASRPRPFPPDKDSAYLRCMDACDDIPFEPFKLLCYVACTFLADDTPGS